MELKASHLAVLGLGWYLWRRRSKQAVGGLGAVGRGHWATEYRIVGGRARAVKVWVPEPTLDKASIIREEVGNVLRMSGYSGQVSRKRHLGRNEFFTVLRTVFNRLQSHYPKESWQLGAIFQEVRRRGYWP